MRRHKGERAMNECKNLMAGNKCKYYQLPREKIKKCAEKFNKINGNCYAKEYSRTYGIKCPGLDYDRR